MELEIKINASAKEVFDELIKAIQEDIKNSTGKKVAVEKICENYSYKKKLAGFSGQSVDVNVNIDKLIYPSQYSATITNSKGLNTIEYLLEDNGDTVTIKYMEKYKSSSVFRNLNNIVMSFLFSRSNKKKAIKRFSSLEQMILEKKDNQ